jgi:3-hydroxybutyryl-CoA dehydrogenase
MEIKNVGVVGCGLMGAGIAQVCAQSGYQVVVSEINDELLNKGLASINSFLTKSVEKGKITQQDKDTTLGRIKGTTDTRDFQDCDLVIEAVVEKMDLKKKIFAELDKICPKHAILASNTSALSVIDIAVVTTRAEKVLALHFMNPAPLMKLLEIGRTVLTSDETLEISRRFGESLGKTVVVTKDAPGLIANRLLTAFLVNAVNMYDSGAATKEDIDAAIRLGLNHPMGPLELADFIGLDTVYAMINAVYTEFNDTRYAPPLLLKKMVTAGMLGRKSGKGFYEYHK